VISDETWDKVRDAWAASIPEAYRWVSDAHSSSNPAASAIIGAVPPAQMLAKFFAQFVPHLTKAQLAAKEARARCGNHVRKSADTPRIRIRASRARKPSSLPLPVSLSDLDYI